MAAAAAAAACKRAVSYTLLGPPAESLRVGATAAASATGDMFVDLLDANFNKAPKPQPAKILTENLSPTFATSGDPCIDFFFHVVPGTPSATVTSLFANAWSAEPATALRLACNLRGVRGTGKSDREGFYAAALWMHGCHPATLALNARPVAEFGYLKDLPEILHRIIHGGESTRTPGKKARLASASGGFVARGWRGFRSRAGRSGRRSRSAAAKLRATRSTRPVKARIAAANERDRKMAAEAAVERRKRRAEGWKRAVDRYARDLTYRHLHDCTADLFADLLAEDMKKLAAGKMDLSLAAKWCPSLESCYDRSTLLCEAIARRLFPRGSVPELPEDLEDEYYAYRVRDLLRKQVLVPLRRALELPEVFISANAWGKVVYPRVASVAMANYKDFFVKHDGERFGLYLGDVKSGKAKISAGALLPHEILESLAESMQEDYMDGYGYEGEGEGEGEGEDDDDDVAKVAELQWERMVSDMRALGKLSNCIAISDVSGSMQGLPMDVSVALGLLISELSDEPWHHRLITFSQQPQLHLITGKTLWEKAQFIRHMDWGYNTNFQAVFDKLLSTAVAGNLPPERMVKKVFVFSDMEFDQASPGSWETDYEAVTRKFTAAGYGEAIPEIVFWNLRSSQSVPVTSDQKGVALVSGYSKNMIKLFLQGENMPTPRGVMDKAISGPEYEKLAVFD